MKIFHKNTCITCKRTITELERMKQELEVRDFFREPFSEDELKSIISKAKIKPSELLRKKDRMYKKLDLGNSYKTDSQLIKLMVKNPGLIRRPIIILKNKVSIGKIDVKDL